MDQPRWKTISSRHIIWAVSGRHADDRHGIASKHEDTMRTRLSRLIYHKWFFGVLAVMFWFHLWTDVDDVIKTAKSHEVVSVIISGVGAIVLTAIFIDLHLRW